MTLAHRDTNGAELDESGWLHRHYPDEAGLDIEPGSFVKGLVFATGFFAAMVIAAGGIVWGLM